MFKAYNFPVGFKHLFQLPCTINTPPTVGEGRLTGLASAVL